MSSSNDYVAYLSTISGSMNYYFLAVILPVGVAGNLISLFIYTRPNLNRRTNTGFLYGGLCITNLFSICYYSFVGRPQTLFSYTVSLPCGVNSYLRRTAFNSISWMQVIISFDRFMAVYYPQILIMNKKWFLFAIMVAVEGLVLVTNMTNLLTYPVTNPVTNRTSCFVSSQNTMANSSIALLMRIIIPFITMITLNSLVISRLKKSKQLATRNKATSIVNGKIPGRLSNKEYKFKVATLIMDFTFLGFHLPVGVNLTFDLVSLTNPTFASDPLSNVIVNNLFSTSSQLLAFGYAVALIFLFFIFNKYFRDEVLALLRLKKLSNQVETSSTRGAN